MAKGGCQGTVDTEFSWDWNHSLFGSPILPHITMGNVIFQDYTKTTSHVLSCTRPVIGPCYVSKFVFIQIGNPENQSNYVVLADNLSLLLEQLAPA